MTEVPDRHEISRLPRLACVAFAARCARRVQPWFDAYWPGLPEEYWKAVEAAVQFAEKSAATGQIDVVVGAGILTDAKRVAVAASNPVYTHYSAENIPKAAVSAVAAALAAREESSPAVVSAAADAVRFAVAAADTADPDSPFVDYTDIRERIEYISMRIWKDFELLCASSIKSGWSHSTFLSPEFFSHHSEFEVGTRPLIVVPSIIDDRVMKTLSLDPKLLHGLTDHQFEEFIAKLVESFGFEVELTQRTRDNGRDIIAIRHGYGKAKYLIECKRYAATNRVGIAVVQRLLGVVISEGATKGIVATTSSFTRPAQSVINTTWWLEGRDFEGLTHWLNEYQRFSMSRDWGVDPPNFI